MAQGIRTDWGETVFTFNFAWALIILNLLAHWLIKLWRYDNLGADDRRIMISTAVVLAVQFVIVLIAAFLPPTPSEVMSWIGMLFGAGVFTQSRLYRRTESRFGHLVERCSLIVIIAFGETIVAIASYVIEASNIVYPLLVFALVVGLFLIYIYEHDNMIDHHKQTDGMGFLTVTGWVIFIIGNLTVGLEYMIMPEVAMLPKSIFLVGALVLYLLTSFVLGIWNKPQFTYSYPYILGRVCTCAFIVLVSVATGFDPLVTLVCDTIAIYFALWHEWRLYRGRTAFMAFSHSLGITRDDIIECGYDIETHRGRREFLRDARARIADGSIEDCAKGEEAVPSDE